MKDGIPHQRAHGRLPEMRSPSSQRVCYQRRQVMTFDGGIC